MKRAAVVGVDPNACDDQGRSALHWAADGGHTHIAIMLLQLGADIDKTDEDGQTPLHYAATVVRPASSLPFATVSHHIAILVSLPNSVSERRVLDTYLL